jgi:hypothetical protein
VGGPARYRHQPEPLHRSAHRPTPRPLTRVSRWRIQIRRIKCHRRSQPVLGAQAPRVLAAICSWLSLRRYLRASGSSPSKGCRACACRCRTRARGLVSGEGGHDEGVPTQEVSVDTIATPARDLDVTPQDVQAYVQQLVSGDGEDAVCPAQPPPGRPRAHRRGRP